MIYSNIFEVGRSKPVCQVNNKIKLNYCSGIATSLSLAQVDYDEKFLALHRIEEKDFNNPESTRLRSKYPFFHST